MSTLRACTFFDFDGLIAESFKYINGFEFTTNLLRFKAGASNFLAYGISKTTSSTATLPIVVSPPLFTAVEQKVVEPIVIVTNPGSSTSTGTTTTGSTSTTTVTIPQITQTSLRGSYRITITTQKLSTLIITIDDQFIRFEGCNLVTLPYVAYDDGTFAILDGGSLTQRACDVNDDDKYIAFFRTVNRYQRGSGALTFFQDGKSVATLTTKLTQDNVKPITGTFGIELNGLDATVKDGNIILIGCNTHTIPFTVDANGFVTFGDIASTRVACPNSDDDVYLKAITTSKTFVQTPEGVSFIGADGIEKIKFLQFVFSSVTPISPLEGQYKARLPSNRVKTTINQKTITLEGCGKTSIDYTLSKLGEIVFGKPQINKKSCEVDYDSSILNSLLRAKLAFFSDIGLTFLNGLGALIGKTNKFVAPISNPLPKFDTISVNPGKGKGKTITFPSGDYTINYSRRNGIRPISCSIKGNRVTVKGCRTYTLNYDAFSDNTIRFDPLSQSESSSRCSTNDDNLFLTEFRDAETFSQSGKAINLFDSSKKSFLSFALGAIQQVAQVKQDIISTKLGLIGLPFYCLFDVLALPFGIQKKQDSVFDWFGLGSKGLGSGATTLFGGPKTIV